MSIRARWASSSRTTRASTRSRFTVTDREGQSSTVSKTIDVQNYTPRVNALDIEALPGGTADLFGRFIDPGWTDAHTATWVPASGDSVDGVVEEEHTATIGSGAVTGTFAAGDEPGESRMDPRRG